MLEALTGTGLATAAGLNAYIPLLIVGLLSRFTDLITLPDGWRWLQNPWVLGILGVLLAVEVVADKIPVVDHINDVVQTVVRPTAGGLVFGATSSAQTVTVSDPDTFFSHNRWVPVLGGIVLALLVHGTKAAARPVINGLTLGTGAPVASTIEDGVSVGVSLVAIVLPVLVLVFLAGLIALIVWLVRRRRARSRHPVPGRP
ncbi:MAG: hypothetical protein QOJ50_208 [Cryptosporangiaceae bacterium]|jgi:hypothetical protein|nr:hypothetical protein [Cryptosporangiaceae bacterium]